MLFVDEVKCIKKFYELKAEWERLNRKSENISPFLTHDWFSCCIANYIEKKELYILVVRDTLEIYGIAPLWIYLDKIRKIKVKKICFISSPDSPFVDFIIKKGMEINVLKKILEHLKEKKEWTILNLDQWPTDASNQNILNLIVNNLGIKNYKGMYTITPYIEINKDWNEFIKKTSIRFRKTNRNIKNRFKKLSKTTIHCYKKDSDGSVYQEILQVSKKSWKEEKKISITSMVSSKLFFESLTKIASKNGWLFVWILKNNGIPIAMEYDIEYNGRVYALRADYDETYAEYSPGAYLEYEIIKYLFENGYKEYNTGPGLNLYKMKWTKKIKKKRFSLYMQQ